MKFLIMTMALIVISACSYNAPSKVAPAYDVYTNYGAKIPGRYALYVDSEKMSGVFKVSGFQCSFHNYPLDVRSAFAVSVQKTLEQQFESIDTVSSRLDRSGLEAAGYDGLVLVEGDNLEVNLKVIPGFWSAEMDADVELVANYTVDGIDGRLIGGSVEGDDDYQADAGFACDGGAAAIGGASEAAIKDLVKQLGERLSNAPRLRDRIASSSG